MNLASGLVLSSPGVNVLDSASTSAAINLPAADLKSRSDSLRSDALTLMTDGQVARARGGG